ncbi:MAG TPA: glucokinase [Thermoanaerobaculia bacterium]|jgi:glucokinase|nr:glucokinase [Thermoanaerobaculia bacterium]
MRLLAGDVGGTKTLLRCVEPDGAISRELRYDSTASPTFDDVLREFLAEGIPGPIDAACFAVAGPVIDAHAEVTNVGWRIDEASLERAFSIGRVSLINDFYAVGLGVPLLGADDVLSLQPGDHDRTAPIAILGAGTGLGEALVVNFGGEYQVLPGEGGHAEFAPQDEEQTKLFLYLHRIHGHVSWERVISGLGLVNIFTFLTGETLDAAEIGTRANAGDPVAAHAFAIFVDAYGAEAGNMALRTLARGGVYLAGGIAAKNISWFTDGRFLDAFCRKGRFGHVMKTIPVDLILNEKVGLIGAEEGARRAAALESPRRPTG